MKDPLYSSYCDLDHEVSFAEIKSAVNIAKCGRSPGIDSISNEILKYDIQLPTLNKIFNVCFDSGIVPSAWSEAIISDPRIPLNYRGISLLSCISKLNGYILNHRLSTFLNNKKILVDEQNGFRKERSCIDHIFVLHSVVNNIINQKLKTFSAFLDLKKAFDSVQRDFLLYKLNNNGIDGKMYFSIKSLYENIKHVQGSTKSLLVCLPRHLVCVKEIPSRLHCSQFI